MALLNEFFVEDLTVPKNSFAIRFADMQQPMVRKSVKWEYFTRRGAATSALRRVHDRGEPFTIRTVQYYGPQDRRTAREAAVSEFSNFVTFFVNQLKTVNVTQHSVYYGEFTVIEVAMAQEPEAVVNVIGTDADGNTVYVPDGVRMVLVWTLVHNS